MGWFKEREITYVSSKAYGRVRKIQGIDVGYAGAVRGPGRAGAAPCRGGSSSVSKICKRTDMETGVERSSEFCVPLDALLSPAEGRTNVLTTCLPLAPPSCPIKSLAVRLPESEGAESSCVVRDTCISVGPQEPVPTHT